MTLTYIYHSCFVVESENFSLIFDYYKDTRESWVKNHLPYLNGNIYVFCSHSHHDHFNADVLQWKNIRSDVRYIFSSDILDEKLCQPSDAVFLSKLESYKDKFINVKAYGSTDLGISFAVEAGGKSIFHAGDLNNWHWKNESTPEEIKEAQDFYLSELNTLGNDKKVFDLAMFPVDPRLGSDFALGAEEFLEKIKVKLFAPMHSWERYDEVIPFEKIAERFGSRFFKITQEGDKTTF